MSVVAADLPLWHRDHPITGGYGTAPGRLRLLIADRERQGHFVMTEESIGRELGISKGHAGRLRRELTATGLLEWVTGGHPGAAAVFSVSADLLRAARASAAELREKLAAGVRTCSTITRNGYRAMQRAVAERAVQHFRVELTSRRRAREQVAANAQHSRSPLRTREPLKPFEKIDTPAESESARRARLMAELRAAYPADFPDG